MLNEIAEISKKIGNNFHNVKEPEMLVDIAVSDQGMYLGYDFIIRLYQIPMKWRDKFANFKILIMRQYDDESIEPFMEFEFYKDNVLIKEADKFILNIENILIEFMVNVKKLDDMVIDDDLIFNNDKMRDYDRALDVTYTVTRNYIITTIYNIFKTFPEITWEVELTRGDEKCKKDV